jgi:hypothetical protein
VFPTRQPQLPGLVLGSEPEPEVVASLRLKVEAEGRLWLSVPFDHDEVVSVDIKIGEAAASIGCDGLRGQVVDGHGERVTRIKCVALLFRCDRDGVHANRAARQGGGRPRSTKENDHIFRHLLHPTASSRSALLRRTVQDISHFVFLHAEHGQQPQ